MGNMNRRWIAFVVKIVLAVGACCICYSAAWLRQEMRHNTWKANAHMQLRMDTQLVFEDLLPRFTSSLNKGDMVEFLSETEVVMMSCLVDGPTDEQEKMRRDKWRDKWLGRIQGNKK